MGKFQLKLSLFVIAFFCGMQGFLAADSAPRPLGETPIGRDAVPDLYAPNLAGPGAFTTSSGGAPVSAINPAQGGDAQRIVFDVGYLALVGLGDEEGLGHAAEFGMLFPTRYGVFGSSLRYVHSPFHASFPVKRTFSGNLNAAKEIYPRMSIGAGLNFGFGDEWSLNGDLGFRWNTGKLGPLDNFTWAVVLRSMGKSWTPSPFTPIGGVSFDFFRIAGKNGKKDPLLLNAAADLSIPSIIDFDNTSLTFKMGIKAEIAELIRVSLSWPSASGINARELYNGSKFPYIPSVGIGVNIVLPSGGERIAGGRLPSDGDLSIDTAYKPLYEGVTAIGAGATWTVGIADKKPPLIVIEYPETEIYFSPTNSGKADYLEFPISITDARYVESWVWEIRDEDGNTVRTYRNKELRPETQGFRNFMSRLLAVKTQVEVPPTLRWDGIGDSGELAPDGRYFFTISAADDSGNKATSAVYEAVLDTIPPEVTLAPMDDTQRVFSPGEGGSKNTITFTPTGSFEDSWEAGIYDIAGNRIRSFAPESGNPVAQVWDGKNDAGAIVADGVYTYRIEATDRALNYGSAVMSNIIVNTIRPVVNVYIADPWFSPNNDGIKDTVSMNLTVPVKDEVTGWTMQIKDRSNNVLRAITQADRIYTTLPDQFVYDGKNNAGAFLEEGEYRMELSVNYLNGFTATAISPSFTLKTTPPNAKVSTNFTAFSPNHGGVQSEMIIQQEGSREQLWTGEIRRVNSTAGEAPVRSFRFTGTPPAELRWDGHGEAGTFAADGEFTYELFATDQAGNTGRSNAVRFRMSTVDTPVMITTDLRAFSPSGNSPKTTINFNPRVQVSQGVVSYQLDVLNSRGQAVRTFEGQGMPPAAINWNGRTSNAANAVVAPEGMYTARLELRYEQGNQPSATSLPFELDITPPKAAVSAPYTIFSPNGKRATIPFSVTTEANDEWEAAIAGANGSKIKTWRWQGAAPQIVWDGKDDAGNAAPDGTYQFTLNSTDAAGNTGAYSVSNLTLDARIPRLILTASETGIAPKPDQTGDLMRFGVMASLQDGIENWSLELKDERGAVLKRFSSQAPAANASTAATPSPVTPPPVAGPATAIGWNGLADNGSLREGVFTPVMTINYIKGDTVSAEAAPILIHSTGPELLFSATPQYFSPDNDGVDDELYISLGTKSPAPIDSWYLEIREPVAPFLLFYRIEGKGSPAEQVIWDGRSNKGELVQSATDYPVSFSATDILGNSSVIESKIGVDVLVIRDGDNLRILVPSIVFRENAADFEGIPTERFDNNLRVLRRIADILNRFRDYKVQVEGHANPVLRTDREERTELQPLSEARARMVMNMLVEFGVSRSRLSSIGMGGTKPVVAYQDRDNWWKNRRVEFILIK